MYYDQMPPEAAQVKKIAQNDSGNAAFWKQFEKPDPSKKEIHGAEITSLGAIRKLVLPAGWVHVKDRDHVRGSGYRKEYSKSGEHSTITVSYGGVPISDDGGKAFLQVLAQKPHKLDEAEISSLEPVLGTRSSSANFVLKNAYTTDTDNSNVLIVEGYRPNSGLHTQEDEMVLYIPADQPGKVVQEVSYRAAHDEYGHHVNQVKDSFENVSLR